jgi:hypothetical protein
MRKVLGLYEHELNGWMEAVLRRVDRVIDVGANDGYFTFGCVAAFRRLRKPGEILAFEPQDQHVLTLRQSIDDQSSSDTRVTIVQSFVGNESGQGTTTLDAARWTAGDPGDRSRTLIKIDVEGAELDVLAGAGSWLNATNFFLIEVHKEAFLDEILRMFQGKGLALERIDQRPLRLIGREVRDEENWWLVSRLSPLT